MAIEASEVAGAITSLQRRVSLAAALRCLAEWGSGGLAVAAFGMVVARGGFGVPVASLSWTLAAIPLGLTGGLVAWLFRRPQAADIRALADARLAAGGRLMAKQSTESPALVRAVERLHVRAHARGAGLTTLAALVMLVGAVLLPTPGRLASAGALRIDQQIDAIGEDVETLEEVGLIPEEEADRLRDALEELSKRADGSDPGATWEALDWTEARVEQQADAAARMLEARQAESSSVEALAEHSLSDLESIDAPGLASAIESMLESSSLRPEEAARLAELAAALAKAGGLTDVARREMLEAMRSCAGACTAGAAADLQSLIDAGLVDAEALARAKRMSEAAAAQLRRMLAEGDCSSDCLMLCLGRAGVPGRGGVTRGPGAAALTWTDSDDQSGLTYSPERVSSQSVNPEDSIVIASARRPPDTEQPGEASAGGAIDPSRTAPSSTTESAPTLPRHRDAVRRYFDRGTPQERKP